MLVFYYVCVRVWMFDGIVVVMLISEILVRLKCYLYTWMKRCCEYSGCLPLMNFLLHWTSSKSNIVLAIWICVQLWLLKFKANVSYVMLRGNVNRVNVRRMNKLNINQVVVIRNVVLWNHLWVHFCWCLFFRVCTSEPCYFIYEFWANIWLALPFSIILSFYSVFVMPCIFSFQTEIAL